MPETTKFFPIPQDWIPEEDGYSLLMACIPNSRMWRAYYRGCLYLGTRGRNWDGSTGVITDAQAIAKEVLETMSTCNLDDLVTAVNAVSAAITGLNITQNVTCAPEVIIPPSVGGCSDPSLDPPVDETAAIPDQPPPGWEELESGIPVYEYRCRYANALADWLVAVVERFILDDVQSTVQVGGIIALAVLLAAYNALAVSWGVASVFTSVDLYAMIKAFLTQTIDLPGLKTILEGNRDDIVCALYDNGSYEAQAAAIDDILDLAGATSGQTALVKIILPSKLSLFFTYQLPTAVGARVKRQIEDYPLTNDCTGCSLICQEFTLFGSEVTRAAKTITFDSQNANTICSSWKATNRVIWYVSAQVPVDPCAGGIIECGPGLTLTSIELLSGTVTGTTQARYRAYNSEGSQVLSTNTLPLSMNVEDVVRVVVTGSTATTYQVRFSFLEDIPL